MNDHIKSVVEVLEPSKTYDFYLHLKDESEDSGITIKTKLENSEIIRVEEVNK